MTMQTVKEEIMQQIKLSPKLSKLSEREMLGFAVTGLNEEAGEVAGLLCREIYKGVPIGREEWLGELGDVLWYFTVALITKGFTFQEIWDYNLRKLVERYAELREKA